jgi:dTDP-4-amino-4,6-dideoxygalactose transaminase
VHRYRELLRDVSGVSVPYRDDEVDSSSCYVMPVIVERAELRDPLRRHMLEEHRVQTSILYPAIHEFTAYGGGSLPGSELVARSELTLPLYPHLSEDDQDRVVAALRDGLRALEAAPAAASG